MSKYKRKTRDCWRFYVNYGQGWEHEITEFTRAGMKENRQLYRESCQFPVRIKRGREKSRMIEFKRCDEARYNEMLNVLPPEEWVTKGFLVSEPWSQRECTVTNKHRTAYTAMVQRATDTGYQYFESTSGLTVPEWRALVPSEILLNTFEVRCGGKVEIIFDNESLADDCATELRSTGETDVTVTREKA